MFPCLSRRGKTSHGRPSKAVFGLPGGDGSNSFHLLVIDRHTLVHWKQMVFLFEEGLVAFRVWQEPATRCLQLVTVFEKRLG